MVDALACFRHQQRHRNRKREPGRVGRRHLQLYHFCHCHRRHGQNHPGHPHTHGSSLYPEHRAQHHEPRICGNSRRNESFCSNHRYFECRERHADLECRRQRYLADPQSVIRHKYRDGNCQCKLGWITAGKLYGYGDCDGNRSYGQDSPGHPDRHGLNKQWND